MMSLAILDVDLGEEFESEMVVGLFGVAVPGEGETLGGEVEFEGSRIDIRRHDCDVDVVLLSFAG